MAVSYTTAATRDAARVRPWTRARVEPLEIALLAASLFSVLLALFAYSGASRGSLQPGGGAPLRPLNINAIADAAALEPIVQRVLPAEGDRRLAAHAVWSVLVQADGGRRVVSDVRAVARARIDSNIILRTPGAIELRARLDEERAVAAGSKKSSPPSIAALTPAQVAEIKPMLSVRSAGDVKRALLLWLAVYVLAFHGVSLLWRVRRGKGDRLLLVCAHLLTAFGLAAMIARQDPTRDSILFVRYTEGVVVGLGILAAVSLVNVRTGFVRGLSYLPLLAAFTLSAILLIFGGGPSGSGAKVNLGPFQPIELIRILLALFLAGYFARHWELLRAVRADALGDIAIPRWLHVPRLRYTLPVLTGVALALGLFFLQKDLGPALMLSVVFLATYGVARGRLGLVVFGASLLAAGFYLGYRLGVSATLVERVRMWQSPWDNAARGGNQIAHALWAMATGGTLGTGVGIGDTGYIPAGYTDLVLAALGEELGFAGLLIVAALYAVMVARAFRIAREASTEYGFFLATILGLLIAVPVCLMAAGIMGQLPLTGVVTPFLSYGGSAMAANFGALGLLASIRSDVHPPADVAPFRIPLRWLGGALAAAAAALLIVAARVQIVQADALVVRSHLGMQGDGMRRYQDNPRVLDLVRSIPRGSIVDRNGLPLAADDRAGLQRIAPQYAAIGITLSSACPREDERCYPLGGRAFHLLGDARTRQNWSASNTSFVERDAESKLRGFDDHAAVVPVGETDGSSGTALRRDYRELIPLLRHRHDPDHPAVKAAMNANRQLRLTIDARLQARVAAIVAEYARKSSTGHAAAVVIDPATGDLLASVSYPWPFEMEQATASAASPEAADAWLDRARYGLYPPGSTFKLVTAAAALRRDVNAGSQTFTCTRLPDNRVGAKVPGYARPVRDDQLDKAPHGTLDMHRALVVSCNAYFAQLAAKLGPQALIEAAQPAEIALARNNTLARVRDTLPQVGYGQGDVLASPLRMARIVAALASDGSIRETRIDAAAPLMAAHPFVTSETARLIAHDMREVVREGTGRSLRGHAIAIAGKTGTAEIAGKPSHSWFVGFAPYGAATHRIAVAVLLENAGYGGTGAAPAAGEIVSAAASLGLVR